MILGRQYAPAAAEDLDLIASRSGLIRQLELEGCSSADAAFGVDRQDSDGS